MTDMNPHPDMDDAVSQFLNRFELDIDDMADDATDETFTQRRFEAAAAFAQGIADKLKEAADKQGAMARVLSEITIQDREHALYYLNLVQWDDHTQGALCQSMALAIQQGEWALAKKLWLVCNQNTCNHLEGAETSGRLTDAIDVIVFG